MHYEFVYLKEACIPHPCICPSALHLAQSAVELRPAPLLLLLLFMARRQALDRVSTRLLRRARSLRVNTTLRGALGVILLAGQLAIDIGTVGFGRGSCLGLVTPPVLQLLGFKLYRAEDGYADTPMAVEKD